MPSTKRFDATIAWKVQVLAYVRNVSGKETTKGIIIYSTTQWVDAAIAGMNKPGMKKAFAVITQRNS